MLAFALGALFLGIPHIQESAEAALAPKKQPPQDGPAGQDPGWLESPPHPPSQPPPPLDKRDKGCDMQGVYCKNETKADDKGNGDGGEKLRVNEAHSGGGGMKKLAKKAKAMAKIAKAHEKLGNAKGNGGRKKLKKKQKAHAKRELAEKRKDVAEKRKDFAEKQKDVPDDGAVSFLQYEAATGDDAVLDADDEGHSAGGAMKKLKKKLKAETKIAEAHERIDNAKDAKKKLKKKQKAEEKMDAAEKRKDAAERRKEGKQEEDGQQEESVWTEDGVDCPAHTASDGDKAKKVWTKLTAKQDGDVCDPEVRKHAFEGMDKDGSGTVDKSEVEAMLEADGAPKEAADMVMGMLDTNGDGTITKEEFNDALVCMMCDGGDDAVSFLQEDEEGEDDAVLADGEGEHGGGNGKKKLKKKIKALEIKAEARKRKMANEGAKKKIKKKIKAAEKMTDAEKRKNAAAEKKAAEHHEGGGDGGDDAQEDEVSGGGQQEESVWTDDGVDCPAPTASDGDKAKKVWTKLTAKQEIDPCDPEVRKHQFEEMDKDGSGTVDKSEVEEFLVSQGAPKEAADMVLGMLDTNGDGTITKEEFNDALVCMMCS